MLQCKEPLTGRTSMVPNNPPPPRKPTQGDAPPRPAAASSPPAQRKPGDRPPPPPVVAYEDVTASCGHPEKFGLFADRLDRFRKDRRKKVTDRPCKACREQKQREEQEAAKMRQAERKQRAEEAGTASGSGKKQGAGKHERLPDASKFEVVYDAAQLQWKGSLTIGESRFTGSAGTLFNLLSRLDRQYRQTLPPPETSAEAGQQPTAP